MRLNSLKPALGSKSAKHRVGRGCGSGWGKTCGRGHKGQTSRSGYTCKVGFEGGQTPIHRRLPKFGFKSLLQRKGRVAEVRSADLARIDEKIIDLKALKAANLVGINVTQAKIILSGELDKAVVLSGANIKVTQGALEAIKKAGGKME